MTLYEDLVWRGLIQDISSDDLKEKLNAGGLTFYIGTDPTASSLHIGHYSSFLITKRLANAGHTPIILVGGATGLIGDPRGTSERELSVEDTVRANFEGLKAQIQSVFGFEVVNNLDWIKGLDVITFLRNYGKYFGVGYMLGKDLVRRQLETTGISYAEFSYMILQALDFKHLHETRGVALQVAGSDQWGNITSGIELVRKTTGDEVYGMTMPLVTDAQGQKFGKSVGNPIWIDRAKTSSYELYQFLINSADSKVIDYLKRLTFLTREEIEEIERQHLAQPEKRLAQTALAQAVVSDLHGADAFAEAESISRKLFSGDIKGISTSDLNVGLSHVPHFVLTFGTLLDVLIASQICKSKREARELLAAGAVSVNGDIVKDGEFVVDESVLLDGRMVVIRRGKKAYYVGVVEGAR